MCVCVCVCECVCVRGLKKFRCCFSGVLTTSQSAALWLVRFCATMLLYKFWGFSEWAEIPAGSSRKSSRTRGGHGSRHRFRVIGPSSQWFRRCRAAPSPGDSSWPSRRIPAPRVGIWLRRVAWRGKFRAGSGPAVRPPHHHPHHPQQERRSGVWGLPRPSRPGR